MTEPFLTHELLARLTRLPKAKREAYLKLVGQREWELCANDIFYWLDASAHPLPYVYTQDPHPLHTCNICGDGEGYHFAKRSIHLNIRHNITVENDGALKHHFTEQDTIRPFPFYLPYIRPIVDAWLSEPLLAVEKSRDMVATWTIVACYTWDTLFHKGRQNLFQSEAAFKTRDLVKRAYTIWRNQPDWLKNIHKATSAEGINKAGILTLPTLQSEIIGLPQGADKVRQFHPTGIFSDEAAFNPDAAATFMAIKPAIQNGGRFTMISSANPSWFQRVAADTLENA